jgi:hypothetical protein
MMKIMAAILFSGSKSGIVKGWEGFTGIHVIINTLFIDIKTDSGKKKRGGKKNKH